MPSTKKFFIPLTKFCCLSMMINTIVWEVFVVVILLIWEKVRYLGRNSAAQAVAQTTTSAVDTQNQVQIYVISQLFQSR